MNEIFAFIISYMGVVVIAFAFIGFLTKGFLWPYLRVKGSRGKALLIKLRLSTGTDVYRVGQVDQGFVIFKGQTKDKRRLSIPKDTIYQSLGVGMLDIDDELNAIMARSYEGVTGFDGEKFNNLYLRTLYRPTIADNKEKIMLVLLALLVIGMVILLYFNYQMSEQIATFAVQQSGVITI